MGRTPGFHTHDFPELFWIESGTAWHLFRDGEQALSAGALVFVAPGDVHAFEARDNMGYRIFNLAFSWMHWRQFRKRYEDVFADPFVQKLPLHARTRQLDLHELRALQILSADLRSGQRHRAALDRFLLNLFHLLNQATTNALEEAAPTWLVRATARMQNNSSALEEGVAAFVRLCHRTPEHVARQTRKHWGRTPTELVNEWRLLRAGSLLAAGDASIVQIAHACGFSNISHFYRLFRQRYGCTPAAHRSATETMLRPSKLSRP